MKKYLILFLLTCPLIAQSVPTTPPDSKEYYKARVTQLEQQINQQAVIIAQLKIQLAQFLGQQGQQELAAAQAKLQQQGVKNDQSITTTPEHSKQAKP